MGRDWGRDQPAGQGPLTFWEMWPVKSPRAKGILRASGNRESVLSEGQALLKYIRQPGRPGRGPRPELRTEVPGLDSLGLWTRWKGVKREDRLSSDGLAS